jgi:hypothetical protein
MMEGKTERNGMMDEKTLSILDQKVIPFNSFYQVKDGEIKEKIPKIPSILPHHQGNVCLNLRPPAETTELCDPIIRVA